MMEKTDRKCRPDYLKAIAAILVVLGHALTYLNNLDRLQGSWRIAESLIYAVHVPLFFAVAGYLCHRQPVGKFYRKKLMRILIPFLTFTVLKLLYNVVFSGEAVSMGLLKSAFLYGNYYWFCYAILLMFLIAPLMWRRDDKTGVTVISVVILIVCLVLQVAFTVKESDGYGPFQILQVIYCYPFFFAGYFFKQYEKSLKRLMVPALAVGAGLTVLYLYIDLNGMEERLFYFPVRTAASLALIVGVTALSGMIPEGFDRFSFLGRISLQIMLFDSFYKVILFKIAERIGFMHPVMCIPITALDIALTVLTCILIRKLPYIRILFGLESQKYT